MYQQDNGAVIMSSKRNKPREMGSLSRQSQEAPDIFTESEREREASLHSLNQPQGFTSTPTNPFTHPASAPFSTTLLPHPLQRSSTNGATATPQHLMVDKAIWLRHRAQYTLTTVNNSITAMSPRAQDHPDVAVPLPHTQCWAV